MAETFINSRVTSIPLAGATIYTAPANTTGVVVGFKISNKHSSQVAVSGTLANTAIMGTNTVIPANSHLELLEGSKIVVATGESIVVIPDTANEVDVVLSLLEITPD